MACFRNGTGGRLYSLVTHLVRTHQMCNNTDVGMGHCCVSIFTMVKIDTQLTRQGPEQNLKLHRRHAANLIGAAVIDEYSAVALNHAAGKDHIIDQTETFVIGFRLENRIG